MHKSQTKSLSDGCLDLKKKHALKKKRARMFTFATAAGKLPSWYKKF